MRKCWQSPLAVGLAFGFVAAVAPLAGGEPEATVPAEGLSSTAPIDTRVDQLAEAYRRLYLAFANADRGAAIEATAVFERATLAAEPKRAFDRLSAADSRIFAEVSELRPEALVSLVLFYQELAYRHATDGNFGMLLRADRATEALLRRMAELAQSDEDRRLAAAAYQGFAVDLLGIHAPTRAAEMLELALAITPNDANANIALAILLQKQERYGAAAARLDLALALAPENREARLRRAIVRARFAPEGKAAAELEALAAGAEGDWITITATQERGRRLMASHKWERAVGWFHAATARFPTEHSFRIALAYSQSRAGRRESAAETARQALMAHRERRPSARIRYAEPPIRLLEQRRAEVRAAAETRWDGLRLALVETARAAAGERLQ